MPASRTSWPTIWSSTSAPLISVRRSMKYENALMTSTIASKTPPYHNVSRVRTDRDRQGPTEDPHSSTCST